MCCVAAGAPDGSPAAFENVIMMARTAPHKRGTLNQLDLDKVRYILGSTMSNAALARELGVSRAAVSNVRTGRTWSWVDDDWDNEDDGLEFEVAA